MKEKNHPPNLQLPFMGQGEPPNWAKELEEQNATF